MSSNAPLSACPPVVEYSQAEQAREDIAKARSEWREGMTALDPEKLVFIDEPKVREAKATSTRK